MATTTFTTAVDEQLTTTTLLHALAASRSHPQEQGASEQSALEQEKQEQAEGDSKPGIQYIHTQAQHSAATSHAENTSTPTVLYVSYSPAPVCQKFSPAFERLVAAYKHSNDPKEREIVWCQMEYDKETSPMMKFGPQHCPILILLKGPKCRTILGGSVTELESAVRSDFLT